MGNVLSQFVLMGSQCENGMLLYIDNSYIKILKPAPPM